MTAGRYLLVFVLTLLVLALLTGANAWLQVGMPTRSGSYACAYIRTKIARGSKVSAPKLVIIAGSNALAGIDTQGLGEKLAIHAFNFGLSASFGPGLQTFEGEKILRPGDAALLPMEYSAYDYESPRNSLVDTVYTCGADYLSSLSWKEKLFYALAVRPQRIIDSLFFEHSHAATETTSALAAHDVGPYGQRPGGNFPIRQISIEANMATQPLEVHMRYRSSGAAAIARFVAWAHANRIAVFATWPNTISLPHETNNHAFAQIRDFYRKLGVEIVGNPQDAMLPAALMGDRFYHPNRKGMAVRTDRLIQSLRDDSAFRTWWNVSVTAVTQPR